MIDERQVFERVIRGFVPPDDSLERLVHRRDRKRRNQRIAAGVVGIAVFVAAVWIVGDAALLDRSEPSVPAVSGTTGPGETGPTVTGPKVTGPILSPWRVTERDIAVGESFMDAWVEGDGEAAATMFSPEGTFDGFRPGTLPALHDWFRAGGWTFSDGGCSDYSDTGTRIGVVDCSFRYENDLTRVLGMDPVGDDIALIIDGGSIDAAATGPTEWYGIFDEADQGLFRSPNPERPDTFGAVWDMFIDWISSRHPEDFGRMYDSDRGYPILDPRSIRLWERYTDEFVASPQALRRSFTRWMASQSLDVQALPICNTGNDRFWATPSARRVDPDDPKADLDDLAVFYSTVVEFEEQMLAELRALPLAEAADLARMDEFVPLAERMIEIHRQQAAAAAAGDRAGIDELFGQRIDLTHQMDQILGCMVRLGA